MSKIVATGHYLPNNAVDNKYFEKYLETNDEWIKQRTGIISRRIAADESCYSMAIKSVKNLLIKKNNYDIENIDLIIVTSSSQELIMPSMAASLKRDFNIKDDVMTFDINSACSGFTHALIIAEGLMKSNNWKSSLIVSAEKYSNILDYQDRNTCILFGDGAGAVIFENDESFFEGKAKTISDPDAIIALDKTKSDYLTMNGQQVYKFATQELAQWIVDIVKNKPKDFIESYIIHQANIRILKQIAKKLNVSVDKFPHNLENYGNTSSASIPILLSELQEENKLISGKKYFLSGFGAGIAYSYAIVEF